MMFLTAKTQPLAVSSILIPEGGSFSLLEGEVSYFLNRINTPQMLPPKKQSVILRKWNFIWRKEKKKEKTKEKEEEDFAIKGS